MEAYLFFETMTNDLKQKAEKLIFVTCNIIGIKSRQLPEADGTRRTWWVEVGLSELLLSQR